MSNNLECEVKALVDESQFITLLNAYKGKGEIREQDNIYFGDSKGIFESLKWGMRIRSRGDIVKLTLKVPSNEGLIEINQVIDSEQTYLILKGNYLPEGEVKSKLASININPNDIKIIGMLHTTRVLIKDNEYELCLDKNSYNNSIDFEIEVEGPSVQRAREYIKKVFEKEKIPFIENHLSKYVRATKN